MFALTPSVEMGGEPCWKRGNQPYITARSAHQIDSSRCCHQQLRDADKIIGGRRQHEEPFDQHPPAVSRFAQAAHSLDPTERLFDLFALDRADAITAMAGGARINRRAAIGI